MSDMRHVDRRNPEQRDFIGDLTYGVFSGSVDANGDPDAVQAGSGLACDLKATDLPLNVVCAHGIDAQGVKRIFRRLNEDRTSFWAGLTDETTNYLYVNDDTGKGGVTDVPPVKGPNYHRAGGAVKSMHLFQGTGGAAASSSTDENPAVVWSDTGTPVLSASQTKFGDTSVYFDGTNEAIESNVAFDTGEIIKGLNVSVWVYPDAITGTDQQIIDMRSYGLDVRINATTGVLQWYLGSHGSSSADIDNGSTGSTALDANGWWRVRIAWDGATYKCYLSDDGATETEEISAASDEPLGSSAVILGLSSSNSNDFAGHMAGFRWEARPMVLGTETPSTFTPGLGVPGEHWFDTSKQKMFEYIDGSGWRERGRVFIGKAVTTGAAVDSVETYEYHTAKRPRHVWKEKSVSTFADTTTSDHDLTGYRRHRFVFEGVSPSQDNVALRARVSDDGGSTFEQDASDYAYVYHDIESSTPTETIGNSSGATYMELTPATIDEDQAVRLYGEVEVFLPEIGYPLVNWWMAWVNDSTYDVHMLNGRGQHKGNDNIITDFRFLLSGGNFEMGRIVHLVEEEDDGYSIARR